MFDKVSTKRNLKTIEEKTFVQRLSDILDNSLTILTQYLIFSKKNCLI